ncbi:MAG: MazG family protein [Pseudoclavibacter sp.]|nr:MazG family protein [Pseudoclavibacter sp.]
MNETRPELERLLRIVERFRGPGGCAWFEAQTHASLTPYLLEETHELAEAIESGTAAERREELGDVLFQVLFHASIAAQDPAEPFGLEEIARDQADKLVRRNPHVFGERPTRDMAEIVRMWRRAKAAEKRERRSVLDGIPQGLPALALADRLIGRARGAGVRTGPAAGGPGPGGAGGGGAAGQPAPRPGEVDEAGERELGRRLLGIVAEARERGLDAERALRGAARELAQRVREAERAGVVHPRGGD